MRQQDGALGKRLCSLLESKYPAYAEIQLA
jgi:hypothetical protein